MQIVGHRGAAGIAPENTLLSFRKALESGCEWVEMDVHVTKEGKAVVIHDRTVDRTTNGSGAVCDMTLAEIRMLRCDQGQQIPTLQEVIDLCNKKASLQIELKSEGAAQAVNDILQRNGIRDVLVMSFHTRFLREMRAKNSMVPLGKLFKKESKETWRDIETVPCEYVCPRYNITTEELVVRAKSMKKKIYVFHVNDDKVFRRLRSWNVDAIGTDRPDIFRELLRC